MLHSSGGQSTLRIDAAIAIVLKEQEVLICQRRQNDTFAGYWEFPGGKCEPGETPEQCVIRELQEEVAITARPIHAFRPLEHDYRHRSVRLHPFLCLHVAGQPRPITAQRTLWVHPPHLRRYRFPAANGQLIAQVLERLRHPPFQNAPAPSDPARS